MFCIDDVRTVSLPPGQTRPLDPLPPFDEESSIKLENDRYCVEVSRANGAITRIFDKAGKLELIREPRLAGNFKFTLPLPGKEPWETIEANYIFGKDQTAFLVRPSAAGSSRSLGGIRGTVPGEQYDAAVIMGIALEDEAIRFTLRIENRTPYQIGEVFFPILGGVTGLGDTYKELKSTRLVRPSRRRVRQLGRLLSLHEFFRLGRPGGGAVLPLSRKPAPSRGWSCPREPVVIAGCTSAPTTRPTGRCCCIWNCCRATPQTPRWDGNWPRREELGGLPAGVLFSFVEFANHPPGKTYEAAPIVLQAHDGERQKGQQIYRKWKASH